MKTTRGKKNTLLLTVPWVSVRVGVFLVFKLHLTTPVKMSRKQT